MHIAEAPRLQALVPDASCANRSNWRTSVSRVGAEGEGDGHGEAPAPWLPRVERLLGEAGWRLQCRHPRLRVFQKASGHQIAWVLSSGRVQIRVPLIVAAESRRSSAERAWRELSAALAGDASTDPRDNV